MYRKLILAFVALPSCSFAQADSQESHILNAKHLRCIIAKEDSYRKTTRASGSLVIRTSRCKSSITESASVDGLSSSTPIIVLRDKEIIPAEVLFLSPHAVDCLFSIEIDSVKDSSEVMYQLKINPCGLFEVADER